MRKDLGFGWVYGGLRVEKDLSEHICVVPLVRWRGRIVISWEGAVLVESEMKAQGIEE